MLNVKFEHNGMTPALFKWSDSVINGGKIPKSGVELFCVTENLPGKNGVTSAWSISFVLGDNERCFSKGWARFLFDEAPSVISLLDRDIKIFDGPRHLANLVFERR